MWKHRETDVNTSADMSGRLLLWLSRRATKGVLDNRTISMHTVSGWNDRVKLGSCIHLLVSNRPHKWVCVKPASHTLNQKRHQKHVCGTAVTFVTTLYFSTVPFSSLEIWNPSNLMPKDPNTLKMTLAKQKNAWKHREQSLSFNPCKAALSRVELSVCIWH